MAYHFIALFVSMKCSHILGKNMYCKYFKTVFRGKYLDLREVGMGKLCNFVNYMLIMLEYVMIDMWHIVISWACNSDGVSSMRRWIQKGV
jgi:hypothetical protein